MDTIEKLKYLNNQVDIFVNENLENKNENKYELKGIDKSILINFMYTVQKKAIYLHSINKSDIIKYSNFRFSGKKKEYSKSNYNYEIKYNKFKTFIVILKSRWDDDEKVYEEEIDLNKEYILNIAEKIIYNYSIRLSKKIEEARLERIRINAEEDIIDKLKNNNFDFIS